MQCMRAGFLPSRVSPTPIALRGCRPHTCLHRQMPLRVTASIDREKMPYQQAELRAADSERKAAVGRLPAACGLAFLSALPALLSGPGTAANAAYGAGGVIIVLIAALEVWLRRETLKKMIMTNRLVLKELQAEAREQRAEALRQQGLPVVPKDLYQAEDVLEYMEYCFVHSDEPDES